MAFPTESYESRCWRNVPTNLSTILNTVLLFLLILSHLPRLMRVLTRQSRVISSTAEISFYSLYLGVTVLTLGQSSAIECAGLCTAWGDHPPKMLVGWQAWGALIGIPQVGVLWLKSVVLLVLSSRSPVSQIPNAQRRRTVSTFGIVMSIFLLLLSVDVASFQQVDGPNDRWAGEWYSILVAAYVWLLCLIISLAQFVSALITPIDAVPQNTLTMWGIGLESCAGLILGASLGTRYFETPFRLDGEGGMKREERIAHTIFTVLPLSLMAGSRLVAVGRLQWAKGAQRTMETGGNALAGEGADKQTSLIHDL